MVFQPTFWALDWTLIVDIQTAKVVFIFVGIVESHIAVREKDMKGEFCDVKSQMMFKIQTHISE